MGSSPTWGTNIKIMKYKTPITDKKEFNDIVLNSNYFKFPYKPRINFANKTIYFKGKILIGINKENNIIFIKKLILLPSKYKRYYIHYKTLRKFKDYSLIENYMTFHYDELTNILNIMYPILKDYYEK